MSKSHQVSKDDSFDLKPEEFKDCVKKLLRIVECPVCQNILKANNISQCVNCHVVCNKCRVQINICPICRQKFDKKKNPVMVSQILDALPQFCKYNGCSQTLRPGEDHEANCSFKTTICKLCTSEVFNNKILDHVQRKHETYLTVEKNFVDFNIPTMFCCCRGTILLPTNTTSMSAFNQFFWIDLGLTETSLYTISIQLVSNSNHPIVGTFFGTVELYETTSKNGCFFSVSKEFSSEENGNVDEAPLSFKIRIPRHILMAFSQCLNLVLKIMITVHNEK